MPTQQSFLRVRGFLLEDMTYIPLPGWETTRLFKIRRTQEDGPHAIRLLDDAGKELFKHRFSIGFIDACAPGHLGARAANVFEAVPFIARARSLEIQAEGRVVHQAPINDRPPVVQVRSCKPVRKWPGICEVDIQVSAAAKVQLSYVAVYRPSAKQLYPVAEQEMKGRQATFEVDLSRLPGSKAGHVIVNVSDGVRSGHARSGPIDLPFPKPEVHMIRPFENEIIPFSQPIALFGTAVLPWGPKLDDSGLSWSVDGKVIASGRSDAACVGLDAGEHQLELKWSGSLPWGAKASAATRVSFKVAKPSEDETDWRKWFEARRLRGDFNRKSR